MTVALSAALFGVLHGYSHIDTGLTTNSKRVYNALVTGFSLSLGLNIASSLTSYAQMMRWRFLASNYRTLQDFELVMNCDSQSKVFRLLWAGRTRGRWYPNKVQILSFTWLALNIGIQVFLALLGLTYSIDISDEWVIVNYGQSLLRGSTGTD
jgi:hypothetical protein